MQLLEIRLWNTLMLCDKQKQTIQITEKMKNNSFLVKMTVLEMTSKPNFQYLTGTDKLNTCFPRKHIIDSFVGMVSRDNFRYFQVLYCTGE